MTTSPAAGPSAASYPFHALKPGDIIGGREVFETRRLLTGCWAAIDADGNVILEVTDLEAPVTTDN